MLPVRFSGCQHLLRRCSTKHGGYRDACPPLRPITLAPRLSPLPLPSCPPSAFSVASCHSPRFPECASVSNLPSENTVLSAETKGLWPGSLPNSARSPSCTDTPWPLPAVLDKSPPDTPVTPLSLSELVAGSEPMLLFLSEDRALAGRGAARRTARRRLGQRHSCETPSAEANGRLSGG